MADAHHHDFLSPAIHSSIADVLLQPCLRSSGRVRQLHAQCEPCDGGEAKHSRMHDTFLLVQHVAKARGKLRPGGTVDTIAAARVVLTDWNDGRIRFYTEPPQRGSAGHDGAAIVKDWATDFDADQVCNTCMLRD